MPEANATDRPPPFDQPFEDEDIEQRIYGVILQTREPTTAQTIAEHAACDPKTARKYLEWFTRLGIVAKHDGPTITYERNDPYFQWRHINELAEMHTREELYERIYSLTDRIEAYREQYDADAPDEVDALAGGSAETIDEVYADFAEWETALRERRFCERARQQLSSPAEPAPR